jgi:hypothetical protein
MELLCNPKQYVEQKSQRIQQILDYFVIDRNEKGKEMTVGMGGNRKCFFRANEVFPSTSATHHFTVLKNTPPVLVQVL